MKKETLLIKIQDKTDMVDDGNLRMLYVDSVTHLEETLKNEDDPFKHYRENGKSIDIYWDNPYTPKPTNQLNELARKLEKDYNLPENFIRIL